MLEAHPADGKRGIIAGKVALVDQNKIGLGLSVFVPIESGDHSDAWLKKCSEAVSSMPEVMEFHRMAGDVDYVLRVPNFFRAVLTRALAFIPSAARLREERFFRSANKEIL